jgi:hypothetical protein
MIIHGLGSRPVRSGIARSAIYLAAVMRSAAHKDRICSGAAEPCGRIPGTATLSRTRRRLLPVIARHDGPLMAFVGLWESSRRPNGTVCRYDVPGWRQVWQRIHRAGDARDDLSGQARNDP